jgi:chromatin remodeling complex protein RSC6
MVVFTSPTGTTYMISPELTDIVGENVTSVRQVLFRVDSYIKGYQLQDRIVKHFIRPDRRLC